MENSESYFIALTTKWCKEKDVNTSFEQNRYFLAFFFPFENISRVFLFFSRRVLLPIINNRLLCYIFILRPSLEAYLTKQLEKIRIDAKQLSFEVFLTNTSELLQITKNLLSVLPVITDDKLLLLTIKIVVIIYSKLITSYNSIFFSFFLFSFFFFVFHFFIYFFYISFSFTSTFLFFYFFFSFSLFKSIFCCFSNRIISSCFMHFNNIINYFSMPTIIEQFNDKKRKQYSNVL